MSYAPRTHWDRFFKTLFQSGDDLDWGDQWTAPFMEPLREAGVRSVLDLGCGSGNEVFRLAQEGFEVTGLDFSEEAITRARSKSGPRAEFVVADMGKTLPFSDTSFDAVMSKVAAHMFSDSITRSLFSEVARMLRTGGLFLFHLHSLKERPLRARRRPSVREIEENLVLEEDGRTVHFFSREYLRELLSGWRTVDLEPVELRHRETGEPVKRVWRGVARR